jgi:LmbE family N-acetylglucosaminyl deacetylase
VKRVSLALLLALTAASSFGADRTILAIGAHCGDMEVTSGAVLLKHRRQGDRIVLLHLTLGEGGNPKMSPTAYGEQKRREAVAAAQVLGAEVLFGPYKDGEIPRSDEAVAYVAEVIRQVKPTHVITHWRSSIHKDHARTHEIVSDALLLASLEGTRSEQPPHRGVRGVYYAENWEDPEGFEPYLYVDISEEIEAWKKCVTQYQFIRGGISDFPYLDYYTALARVRGAESRRRQAVAFDVAPLSKRQVVDALP